MPTEMKWNFASESDLVFAVERLGPEWKRISEEVFHNYSAEKLRNKYYKMRERGLLSNYIGEISPSHGSSTSSSNSRVSEQADDEELEELVRKMLRIV